MKRVEDSNRDGPTVISRLAGSLIVHGQKTSFIVGQPKEPCCWSEFGLTPSVDLDHWEQPFVAELKLVRPYSAKGPLCTVSIVRDEELHHDWDRHLAETLASRLLIERNGSVSERLWNLVGQFDTAGDSAKVRETNIDWLIAMPSDIWDIVRDTVLRCV